MLKTRLLHAASLAALACALGSAGSALAASGDVTYRIPGGTVIVPQSSLALPQDKGLRAHTNVRFFVPDGHIHIDNSAPSGKFENPASLACVYGVAKFVKGCNPETLTTVTTGGSKMIAIVDAYDYPTAANDLGVYSTQYGLPAITAKNFQVVYAAGTKPPQDQTGGWEVEEALDIEMAHALAPGAEVVLVEAASNSGHDLKQGDAVAAAMVAAAGGGEVSNSWEGGEYAKENNSEKAFAVPGVVYFASSGDSAGTGWPSALANIVAVGGTYIDRDSQGNFVSQSAWSATGGGPSAYVPRPDYQDSIQKIVGTARGIPDISLDASPASGVWIYDTTPAGGRTPDWTTVGGTSVASPASAALINNAGHFFTSTEAELTQVYAAKKKAMAFTDITAGDCGSGGKFKATKGWDFCTGVGTPFGSADK